MMTTTIPSNANVDLPNAAKPLPAKTGNGRICKNVTTDISPPIWQSESRVLGRIDGRLGLGTIDDSPESVRILDHVMLARGSEFLSGFQYFLGRSAIAVKFSQ